MIAGPAVRTRGTSLAVATLAMALMFNSLLFTNSSLTGGVRGLPIDDVSFLGLDLDPLEHPQRYGAFVLGVLVIVGLVVANLRRGRAGARLLAVRSNERAAASLGIGVVAAKVYAFGVAAAIAALGGALLSLRQANVQFGQYNVFSSVLLIQYAVVGGLAWISGAVAAAIGAPGALGALLFEKIVPEGTDIISWLAILSAIGAVTLLRQAPDGTASLWSRAAHRVAEPFQLPRPRPDAAGGRRAAAPTGRHAGRRRHHRRLRRRRRPRRRQLPGLARRGGRAHRAERRREDDAARRRHRFHAVRVRARSASTAPPSTGGRSNGGRGRGSSARGRPSSCSRS